MVLGIGNAFEYYNQQGIYASRPQPSIEQCLFHFFNRYQSYAYRKIGNSVKKIKNQR